MQGGVESEGVHEEEWRVKGARGGVESEGVHEEEFVGRKRGCMDRDFGSFG